VLITNSKSAQVSAFSAKVFPPHQSLAAVFHPTLKSQVFLLRDKTKAVQ